MAKGIGDCCLIVRVATRVRVGVGDQLKRHDFMIQQTQLFSCEMRDI